MLQLNSSIKIIDNTPVKEIYVIKVLKRGRKNPGIQGDLVVGVVKSLGKVKKTNKNLTQKSKQKDWTKGNIVKALIVRTKRGMDTATGQGRSSKIQTGIRVAFPQNNAGILVNNTNQEPLGSRLKGPLPRLIKNKGFTKLLSLGSTLL
jgi:large subunit ribosomal protein L14